MKYNFDQEIDRRGTSSVKWEFVPREGDSTKLDHTDQFFGEDRMLPMWVADMDFRCPQPVIDALAARVQHGIFGYTMTTEKYLATVAGWMQRRHGWAVEPGWIVTTPGVVTALNFLVRTFVKPGEKVLIQPPVYYPFYKAIENNGGEVCRVPLLYQDGRYTMDFDGIEAALRGGQVRATILCNPHNPVGRAWAPAELARFGELCRAHDVLVIADEIHGDLVMRGAKYTPYASLNSDFLQHSVTCTAASKTFNLAGLSTSNIIIADPALRAAYQATVTATGVHGAGLFGIVALEAAYNHGEDWLEQVLDYIQGNLDALAEFLATSLPQIRLVPLEGTYLAWLDCRGLGLDTAGLHRLLIDEVRVYLDEGDLFGAEGAGFVRVNLACPRAILAEALDRFKQAIGRLDSQPG